MSTRMSWITLGVVWGLCAPTALEAQSIFKCKDAQGSTVYSNMPCPQGAQGGQVRIDAHTPDAASIERNQAMVDQQRTRQVREQTERDARRQGPVPGVTSATTNPRCEAARKKYESASRRGVSGSTDQRFESAFNLKVLRGEMENACGVTSSASEKEQRKDFDDPAAEYRRRCYGPDDFNCTGPTGQYCRGPGDAGCDR